MPPIFAKNAKNGSKFFKIYSEEVVSRVKFNSKGGLFYEFFWFGPSLKRYFNFLNFSGKIEIKKSPKGPLLMTNDTWFLVTKWPKMMGIPTVGWVEFGQLIISFRDSVLYYSIVIILQENFNTIVILQVLHHTPIKVTENPC